MSKEGWWARFLPGHKNSSSSAAADATNSADPEEFDEVLLPPGASADDEAAGSSSNADAEGGDAAKPKRKKKAKAADGKSQDGGDGGDGGDDADDCDEDDEDGTNPENPDDDEIDNATSTEPGATTATSANGASERNSTNVGNTITTGAAAPAAATPAPATASEHPVLTAALAGGIDTEAKFSALVAEAAIGKAALVTARADANAAAVAAFGTGQPEKIKAAESLVGATSDLAQLNLLTDNWNSMAPGAGRNTDAAGKPVRTTRSNGPAASGAGAPKPAAKEVPKTVASISAGNIFDQYNKPKK